MITCFKQFESMKKAHVKFLYMNVCVLMIAGCNTSSPGSGTAQPTIDSTRAAKAVAAEQQVFMDAFRKADSISVADVYTHDAKVMNAGMPAMITTKTLGVWNNTKTIVEEGKWIISNKEGEAYDHGKYLILWKMEDGKWKKFRDCHNSDIYPK
jgi:ketosteroid isomerase-like protein